MRWPRPLAGDVRGGITAAIVDLGLLLTYGLLAFGALGVEHADRGILAAFVASIFGGLVANLLGSAAIPGSGPRASSTLILATFVAALVADGSVPAAGLPSVEAVFFLAAACVALAGLIQLAFAVARLDSLVKFVPHPVVSGFMNGIAILIVISQLPNGVPSPPLVGGWVEAIGAAQAGTVFIGLAAAAVVWIVTWRWPRAPAALVAVVAGVLLYHGLAASIPSLQLGPLLEPVAGRLPPPTALAPIVSDAGWNLMRTHWADVVGTAFVIATVGSLDSLLAAAGADVAHGTRHDANRELAGQGFGNVVSGLLGGLPITFSQARARGVNFSRIRPQSVPAPQPRKEEAPMRSSYRSFRQAGAVTALGLAATLPVGIGLGAAAVALVKGPGEIGGSMSRSAVSPAAAIAGEHAIRPVDPAREALTLLCSTPLTKGASNPATERRADCLPSRDRLPKRISLVRTCRGSESGYGTLSSANAPVAVTCGYRLPTNRRRR
jgi:SulP family sulfate permease